MISYKDRAYCHRSATKECININCSRYFTDQEREAAIKWWGSDDAPVAFSDFKDVCTVNYQKGEDCG